MDSFLSLFTSSSSESTAEDIQVPIDNVDGGGPQKMYCIIA